MRLLLIVILLVIINCNTEQKKMTTTIKELKREELPKEKKDFLRNSNQVNYYEIPELTEIINPEDMGTFSIPVRNLSHIERFRILVTSTQQSFFKKPPNNCNPSFNSALVFKDQNKSETILYSRNCGLLYLFNEKLYVDIKEQNMQIENTFRMIRSGR